MLLALSLSLSRVTDKVGDLLEESDLSKFVL